MMPWKWLYWRIQHVFGWHYTGKGNTHCKFCPWVLKRDRAYWEDMFEKTMEAPR